MPKDPPKKLRGSELGTVLSASVCEMAVGVALGHFVGTWLDRRFTGTAYGVLVGVMIGLAAGMYLLIKDAIRMNKDLHAERCVIIPGSASRSPSAWRYRVALAMHVERRTLREMIAAADAVCSIASEAACVPILLTRGATQASVAQAALGATR